MTIEPYFFPKIRQPQPGNFRKGQGRCSLPTSNLLGDDGLAPGRSVAAKRSSGDESGIHGLYSVEFGQMSLDKRSDNTMPALMVFVKIKAPRLAQCQTGMFLPLSLACDMAFRINTMSSAVLAAAEDGKSPSPHTRHSTSDPVAAFLQPQDRAFASWNES